MANNLGSDSGDVPQNVALDKTLRVHLPTCCQCPELLAKTPGVNKQDESEKDEQVSVVGGEALCGESWGITQ